MADILIKHHATPVGFSTYMLVIDFKNAFGTVMHTLIKSRFSKFVKCYFLKYLCGELDDRTAVVREKNMFSDIIKHIAVGLPQGSALGPIGFNCMSGTITQVIKNVPNAQITLFADDCLVLLTEPNLAKAKESTQILMQEISKWADVNGLVLAPSKCNYLIIGKEGDDHIDVELKGVVHQIKQVNKVKYLGFRFDSGLCFKKQINHLKGKLIEIRTSMINVMRVIDREKALKVARSLIYGNLNYGAEITPLQTPKTYREIDRMIVQIVEDIFGWEPRKNNFTSNRKAFNETGWINYMNLHHMCILRFVNRILVNGVPNQVFENVSKFFYWEDEGICRKRVQFNSGLAEAERILKINQKQVQKMVIKKSEENNDKTMFPYNAVELFNALPNHIREIIGTEDFGPAVANFYKSKCQHRIGNDPKKCKGCIEKEILNEEAEIEYTGFGLQFDPVSFAGYRADARTNKEIGNIMNNINKNIATSIKQKETWDQLVQVESEIWLEKQKTIDCFTKNKGKNNYF